jgi:hypothetical protein
MWDIYLAPIKHFTRRSKGLSIVAFSNGCELHDNGIALYRLV